MEIKKRLGIGHAASGDLVSLPVVKSWMRLSVVATGLMFGILGLGGCGGESAGSTGKNPEAFVANASPDTAPLAFFFNDDQFGGNLANKSLSPLFQLPILEDTAGGFDVSLEDPDRSNQWDLQEISLAKDSSTIFAAVGLRDPAGELEKRLRFVQITPNRIAPIGNRARLIILHGFVRKTGFGTPKLALQNDKDNPLFQSPTMKFGDSVVLEVDSGSYSGANHWIAKDPDNDKVYVENPGFTLKAGGIYLVMISGLEGTNEAITFKEVLPKD